MHHHWCEVTWHAYDCGEDCICECGLPMEDHDYSKCRIELRPCSEHKEEQDRQLEEAREASEPRDADFGWQERYERMLSLVDDDPQKDALATEIMNHVFGPAPDGESGQVEALHCECGCADDPEKVIGFCMWCDHVYVDYNPQTEDDHFAHHCPNAPDGLKESAQKRLAERRA